MQIRFGRRGANPGPVPEPKIMVVARQLKKQDEIRRLVHYLSPHVPLLIAGILLIAVMGIADGLVAFAIKPALDIILNPHSTVPKLELFRIPNTAHVVYLNWLVPSRLHHVWSVFAVALLFLSLIKGVTEYFGSTLIQYVG